MAVAVSFQFMLYAPIVGTGGVTASGPFPADEKMAATMPIDGTRTAVGIAFAACGAPATASRIAVEIFPSSWWPFTGWRRLSNSIRDLRSNYD
ncbi:hypothetical protein EN962_34560 [Mesorhizobium sp. M7A.F.Ca.CA.001.09.2.1]|uniref:Uncharacterized protein n=1 Tax=Mesorhizobium ciceri TaxID=39645 RepID=A0AB38T5I1_9HYPH|nr:MULTISPECIES: hypothetical protein [Mesorhizobium]RUY47484.1 hypothetical protein EN981_17935 [Mesorhizobium sp. M7A.F.Ca.CA.001.13.2.1]MBZ9892286.1 hypothetical protein [Mesorhizobium sp. BR1-1-3]MDF3151588.1 hypothetical protein [Mesorhizobium sp. XAP10]MDF3216767.1 hypothetical protein [Mesorhizobium ciceri]MDF3244474.1 hypothetical protein [Mesorhizobium sp. XAP4]